MLSASLRGAAAAVREDVLSYLMRCRETAPGEYYGAFWSAKGYHGPRLDYHAGGSHHHRSAGSAALALWQAGQARGDTDMSRAGEVAERLLTRAFSQRTASGLLPMRDRGEEITECVFMQADMLLFLQPYLDDVKGDGTGVCPRASQ